MQEFLDKAEKKVVGEIIQLLQIAKIIHKITQMQKDMYNLQSERNLFSRKCIFPLDIMYSMNIMELNTSRKGVRYETIYA